MNMKKYLKDLEDKLNYFDNKLNEIYSSANNDYRQKITNLRQSINQKKNWIKYRIKYTRGIKKSNTLNPYKDIRKSFLNNMK